MNPLCATCRHELPDHGPNCFWSPVKPKKEQRTATFLMHEHHRINVKYAEDTDAVKVHLYTAICDTASIPAAAVDFIQLMLLWGVHSVVLDGMPLKRLS